MMLYIMATFIAPSFSATPIDLHHHSTALLKKIPSDVQLQLLFKNIDARRVAHLHVQQMYSGIPVWGATAVIHIPQAEVKANLFANLSGRNQANGILYDHLAKELGMYSQPIFTQQQRAKIVNIAKEIFQTKTKLSQSVSYQEESAIPVIYIDKNQSAHYAFLVSFLVDDNQTGAHRPTMIIDAINSYVYYQRDQVKHLQGNPMPLELVSAAGIGGNQKTGAIIYDDLKDHLSSVTLYRSSEDGVGMLCHLINENVTIKDVAYDSATPTQPCPINGEHNGLSWLDSDENNTRWKDDEANGGYSPSLDALYSASITHQMYYDWYGIPVLMQKDRKTPMQIMLRVHYGRHYENAYWDDNEVTLGDGGDMLYPLPALDIIAHEISHGFTEQNAGIFDRTEDNLQMSALDESFADMASQAAQFYVSGKNNWMIGSSVTKTMPAMRYMDDPKKDGSSLDNFKDLNSSIKDPHLAAGIVNKAFYLIATSPNWNIRKAFDVMVEANRYYWTSSMTTFSEAACGVLSATQSLQYNVQDVKNAFVNVGIDVSKC